MNIKQKAEWYMQKWANAYKNCHDMKKKGQSTGAIFGLISAVLALTVLGIVLSMAGLTQAKIGSQVTSGTIEYNATVQAREGVKVASDFQPTLATILVIGAILVILIGALGGLFLYTRGR